MAVICDQAERAMLAILWIVLIYPFSFFRPRQDLALEVLALRHQLMVLKRQTGRPKLRPSDRYLWLLLMRGWPNWRNPLILFRPETLIGWQRAGFKTFCRWQLLESYFEYYHQVRPHRSLCHDSPIPRPVESSEQGKVIELPQVGGLHHRYLRQAA